MSLEKAIACLREGGMVLIYDGDDREGEADMVFHASFASADRIERLRRDAGGLICLSIEPGIAKRMALPFYTDILADSDLEIKEMECTKTAYKDRPAFSIPINHKGVFTGITDDDRALTIREMAKLAEKEGSLKEGLIRDFYSPGHIFLLIGRGVGNRKGHTELTLELARRSGLSGMMVLCEMLGKGKALPKEKARGYAKENGFVFIEGSELYG